MSHCTKPMFVTISLGGMLFFRKSIYKMIRQQARVAILGDSIVEGLARYPAVWNDHLKPFNTVNCGIGGDSIQHLLWRVGHLSIPHVIVTGILPRDLHPTPRREQIQQNKFNLKKHLLD